LGVRQIVKAKRHASVKKVIVTCIYCTSDPDGEEHWLNRSFGTFRGNTFLTERICTPCNEEFGRTIDQEVARTGHSGMFRQVLGIKGRSHHERKNVFDYKASQLEPPVQTFHVDGDELTEVFQDAVSLNPDGTLKAIESRVLVVEVAEGKLHTLRFPKAWGETQLRAAVESRGLQGARPVRAHVPAPETTAEFEATSTAAIRAVFGPFSINVETTDPDSPSAPVVPTLMRFNLSPEFLRGVAKIAFHYFMWACPRIGGDEPEFSSIKAFIRFGTVEGEVTDHIRKTQASLVDRIPTDHGGAGDHGHVFASFLTEDHQLVVQVHFFSLNIGPSFPTFIVRLGPKPDALPAGWRTTHLAAYRSGIDGPDGVLKDVLADGEVEIIDRLTE
jgi:hypothetical protein